MRHWLLPTFGAFFFWGFTAFLHTFVFVSPNSGQPYLPDLLQRMWRKACRAIGIEISLQQATRHSVASMAASSGVSIAIIKEVLGHTDIRTTQRYSHINVISQGQVFEAQRKTVSKLSLD